MSMCEEKKTVKIGAEEIEQIVVEKSEKIAAGEVQSSPVVAPSQSFRSMGRELICAPFPPPAEEKNVLHFGAGGGSAFAKTAVIVDYGEPDRGGIPTGTEIYLLPSASQSPYARKTFDFPGGGLCILVPISEVVMTSQKAPRPLDLDAVAKHARKMWGDSPHIPTISDDRFAEAERADNARTVAVICRPFEVVRLAKHLVGLEVGATVDIPADPNCRSMRIERRESGYYKLLSLRDHGHQLAGPPQQPTAPGLTQDQAEALGRDALRGVAETMAK